MPKAKKSIQKFSKKSSNTPSTSSQVSSAKRSSFWSWLDDNILLLCSGFLFAFIPLFPKIPLADIIPGYLVRLRMEDLFVSAAILLYFIQILRKKAEWKTPFTWIVVSYAVVGLLSTFSAVFITQTVPMHVVHVGKTLLHFFRYMEYFSLFFLAFASIKKRQDIWIFLGIFISVILIITMYGFGQKYYYLPVYSTMNREFSKGVRLYLTEHARVQSTFGGHYDMAGYLVVALPLMLTLGYSSRKKLLKLTFFFGFLIGLWLLIMSASRTSFVAFIFGIGVTILLYGYVQETWKQKILWLFTRGFLLSVVIMYMFFTFGESIAERFEQVIAGYPAVHEKYKVAKDARNLIVEGEFDELLTSLGFKEIKLPEAKVPENAMSTAQLEANVLTPTDTVPTTQKPTDVYENIPDVIYLATESAEGSPAGTRVEVPRTWSDCSLKYGLSLCIRLDTLWPRAIAGFRRNPLLGSGYATLTKEDTVQFTEAESTDNNFLRTLGETGLLGFITFYSTVGVIFYYAFRNIHSKDLLARGLAVGIIGSTCGLLFNAIYIDVFAASKIAFTFWALSGYIIAYLALNDHEVEAKPTR